METVVSQRLDRESRVDRGKLTVHRFSIKFRGRKRNGSGNFPCNFQRDILLPSPVVIPVARVLSCLNRGFKVPREIVHSTCTWRLRARQFDILNLRYTRVFDSETRFFFLFARNVANFYQDLRWTL